MLGGLLRWEGLNYQIEQSSLSRGSGLSMLLCWRDVMRLDHRVNLEI